MDCICAGQQKIYRETDVHSSKFRVLVAKCVGLPYQKAKFGWFYGWFPETVLRQRLLINCSSDAGERDLEPADVTDAEDWATLQCQYITGWWSSFRYKRSFPWTEHFRWQWCPVHILGKTSIDRWHCCTVLHPAWAGSGVGASSSRWKYLATWWMA